MVSKILSSFITSHFDIMSKSVVGSRGFYFRTLVLNISKEMLQNSIKHFVK